MHELAFLHQKTGNMFRSLAMFLRWKNAVFVTLEICFSKDKLLSNITPRFLTVEEVTGHPSKLQIVIQEILCTVIWSNK